MKKRYDWFFYVMACLYVLPWYLFPTLGQNKAFMDTLGIELSVGPVVLHILASYAINILLTILLNKKVDRRVMLNCIKIIKFGLVPFFVYGAILELICLFISITPLVLFMFAPAGMAIMTLYGLAALIGAVPFALCYLIKGYYDKVYNIAVVIICSFAQFIFVLDVASAIFFAAYDTKKRARAKLERDNDITNDAKRNEDIKTDEICPAVE